MASIEGNMNIGDLIWEQNEKVMLFLFAKINGFVFRKFGQISRPLVLDCVVSDGGEKKEKKKWGMKVIFKIKLSSPGNTLSDPLVK